MIDTVTVRLTNRRTEEQKEIPGAQNRHSNRLTDKKRHKNDTGRDDRHTDKAKAKETAMVNSHSLPSSVENSIPESALPRPTCGSAGAVQKEENMAIAILNGERPAADGEAPAPPRCYNKTYNFPCGPVNQLYKQYWPVITILDLEINQFVTELRER